ncbi:MAG TPA: hypothetical protein VMT17_01075 [Anaeromyxobacteraceae bacterium]|nr:hypothetical protein [Anaeromyxobacteraceae bacterium]
MADSKANTGTRTVEYAEQRRLAALKAAETVRRRKKSRHQAALKAAATKRSPPHKAKTTARKSQEALSRWAKAKAWHLVFLDAASGNPRTGIVDAVLLRITLKKPDVVQVRLVQLKGGLAGLKPREVTRLEAAVRSIDVRSMYALYDGTSLNTIMKPRAWFPVSANPRRG